jgi:predicted alpha/beta superfamily hydrolase
VRLPPGDDDPGRRHPLLVKLDGEEQLFSHTCDAMWYLAHVAGQIPDAIVVGLANTDRGRDMAPERGGDRFVRFIRDELLPFLGETYRCDGFRILCGQSAGSLLACYAFLTQPGLFDAHVMNSFGPSKAGLATYVDRLADLAGLELDRDLYLFFANAEPDPYDPGGERTQNGLRFLDALRQSALPRLHVCYQNYPGTSHAPYPAEYDALRWIYAAQS